MNNKVKNKLGFTLAEILLALTIIGVLTSIIMPVLIADIDNMKTSTELKTGYSIINGALQRTTADNANIPIKCYYYAVSPYGAQKCNAYNANGDCSQYTFMDGSPIPADVNGYFTECSKFVPEMRKYMVVNKSCAVGRAIADNCIPRYKGNDTVQLENNSSNTMYTQYNANSATTGCSGWRQASFASKEAIVLNNGMILIPYSSSFANSAIIGIDVNGKNPPNRAGYDLFFFYPKGSKSRVNYYPGGCEYIEKGGRSASTILKSN